MSQLPSRPIVPKGERRTRHGLKTTGAPTKAEKARMDAIREFGCILTYYKTGIRGTPCAVHHMLTGRIPGRRNNHMRTIGLAPRYHQDSPEAIHTLNREPWEKLHGVTEERLWELTNEVIGVFEVVR